MIVSRHSDVRIRTCVQSNLREQALAVLVRLIYGLVEETLVWRARRRVRIQIDDETEIRKRTGGSRGIRNQGEVGIRVNANRKRHGLWANRSALYARLRHRKRENHAKRCDRRRVPGNIQNRDALPGRGSLFATAV